jgi:Tfp pilus assembly ATPase PilU
MPEKGRIAAVEVMVVNDRIAELIRESRAEEITQAIREGSYYDMQTMNDALIDLTLAGLVDREIATNAAPNAHDFQIALSHAEKTRAAEAAEKARREAESEEAPAVEDWRALLGTGPAPAEAA